MTKYISVLQLKGGVGKTTIAANLAGYFLSKNKKVLAVDADMKQGTLSAWSSMIEDKNFQFGSTFSLDELITLLKDADEKYDFVIVDLPPRLEDLARSSLLFSDLILMPVTTSAPDFWAASDISELIETAKAEKPDLKLRLVWNKFKPTKRRLELQEQVKEMLGHESIKQPLSDYIAYSDVMGMGTWVGAYNHQKAKIEFLDFSKEIEKLIK
ncbi:ParA family protein [Acinetobacter sp. CFCC 10889]|uniref:ParA family protein n=1 Tax=Acinetobacter sp. CFCC 10889 TaxID=1775557 RepID=UPI000DCFD5EE|nr:ParA family protein [Acinetobacter sp. CFCC 10889]